MTAAEFFQFLDTKRRLISPHIRGAGAEVIEQLFAQMTAKGIDSLPIESLRSLDETFDGVIAEQLVEKDEATVRAQLNEQFGFSSFAEQPDRVLKRILRERKVRNEKEAKLVQDFLSGFYLGWTADAKKVKRLSEILANFECH